MHKRISANDSDSFRSSDVKAHETARLFDELLPWTFKCRTLIDAARHGLTAQCEELIELGVDINESDDDGNTPVWTSYFHEHLDTLFTLLQLGADPNTRSGEIFCSDLHRACSLGDRTLVEILIECGGDVNIADRNGRTPLIYALEYTSASCTLDLISYLIEHGANVNHRDRSGLTPLHYACYRGDYPAMAMLIEQGADISIENSIGYNILRYALSCLSFTSPSQRRQYSDRLRIVDVLISQYSSSASLHHALIGSKPAQRHLLPLFDLIFYALIQQRQDLESFAWAAFTTIAPTSELSNSLHAIVQNTFVHSHYVSHVIYICQRLRVENHLALLSYYVDRVTFDAKPDRFSLLLHIIYADHGLTFLQTLHERCTLPLSYSRRCVLDNFIAVHRKQLEPLKFYCRRTIRHALTVAIHCRVKTLHLNAHLIDYVLLGELDFLPSHFFGRSVF